jgi:hypothetical protein
MGIHYNGTSMERLRASACLSCFLAAALSLFAQETVPAEIALGVEQQIPTAGITCCDEHKIRQAMAEEALARVAARAEPDYRGAGPADDYLSGQAYEKIRKRLPAGGLEQRLAYLRDILERPAPDADIREFQTLVGHFVLGMTLEIGSTFQDEYDQALLSLEKVDKLLSELERSPAAGEEDLRRSLFRADLSERELRRIRGLERRWKDVARDTPPVNEFKALRKNVSGRGADPDQWLVFLLSERYRDRFPFLDEFLANYRRLAADFREAARRLNERLLAIEQ